MRATPRFNLQVPEVIGHCSEEEIASRLKAAAQQNYGLEADPLIEYDDAQTPVTLEAFRWPWDPKTPPWKFTDHAYGYLPLDALANSASVDVVDAGTIRPDATLRGANIRISLDRLRVFQYPGSGQHNILFGFSAVHEVGAGVGDTQDLRFNQNYKVIQGSGAGVRGYPIFDGLKIAKSSVAFECTTVNVSNVDDKNLLSFLNSDILNKGMSLLNTVNPAIPIASSLATGILRAFASRNENITVQHFQLGLDLEGGLTGVMLREGSYIAVQVENAETWNWSNWTFQLANGSVVSRQEGLAIPLNYIIFRINRVDSEEKLS